MFGLSMGELFLIMLVALLVFGPRKLPEMARSLGKALRAFQDEGQKAASVFRDAMDDKPRGSKTGVVDRPDAARAISAEPAAPQAAPAAQPEPTTTPAPPAPVPEPAAPAPEPAAPVVESPAPPEGNGRPAASRPTPLPEAPGPPPEPIDPETRLLEDT